MSTEQNEVTISVKLTEDEAQRLMIHAGAVGLTAGGLLQAFVSDLTHSNRSNGSDERETAYAWYDRSLLGEVHYIPEHRNLLQYMLSQGGLYDSYVSNDIQEIIDAYNELQELQEDLEDEELDEEDRRSTQEGIDFDKALIKEIMQEYARATDREVSELNQQEEISRLCSWKQEYDGYQSA